MSIFGRSKVKHGDFGDLSYDDLQNCVHCGLCLSSCPTYRETGTEMDSPRGRIYLIRSVLDKKIPITDNFLHHIDFCLDCRACETVCPSGVKIGELMEEARGYIEQTQTRSFLRRWARSLVFRRLLSSPRNLASVAWMLWIFQQVLVLVRPPFSKTCLLDIQQFVVDIPICRKLTVLVVKQHNEC